MFLVSSRLAVVFVQYIETRCWVENEDGIGAAPTDDAPTTSECSTSLLPTMVRLILEIWRQVGYQDNNFNDGHQVTCPMKCSRTTNTWKGGYVYLSQNQPGWYTHTRHIHILHIWKSITQLAAYIAHLLKTENFYPVLLPCCLVIWCISWA